jgi:hypothetical protein
VTDATGASGAAEYAERIPRLATAFLDPDVGLLVWAPFGVLAFVSIVLLVRALRDRLAVAIPGVVDVEVSAGLLVVLCAVQIGVAVLLTPSLEEPAFPARELIPVLPVGTALAAWALRRLPRAGLVLATVTVGASAWLLIGGRFSGASLAPPRARSRGAAPSPSSPSSSASASPGSCSPSCAAAATSPRSRSRG